MPDERSTAEQVVEIILDEKYEDLRRLGLSREQASDIFRGAFQFVDGKLLYMWRPVHPDVAEKLLKTRKYRLLRFSSAVEASDAILRGHGLDGKSLERLGFERYEYGDGVEYVYRLGESRLVVSCRGSEFSPSLRTPVKVCGFDLELWLFVQLQPDPRFLLRDAEALLEATHEFRDLLRRVVEVGVEKTERAGARLKVVNDGYKIVFVVEDGRGLYAFATDLFAMKVALSEDGDVERLWDEVLESVEFDKEFLAKTLDEALATHRVPRASNLADRVMTRHYLMRLGLQLGEGDAVTREHAEKIFESLASLAEKHPEAKSVAEKIVWRVDFYSDRIVDSLARIGLVDAVTSYVSRTATPEKLLELYDRGLGDRVELLASYARRVIVRPSDKEFWRRLAEIIRERGEDAALRLAGEAPLCCEAMGIYLELVGGATGFTGQYVDPSTWGIKRVVCSGRYAVELVPDRNGWRVGVEPAGLEAGPETLFFDSLGRLIGFGEAVRVLDRLGDLSEFLGWLDGRVGDVVET